MRFSPAFLGATALTAVVSVSLAAAPARADTVYDWTISGGSSTNNGDGTLSGSGTITLSSTPTINSIGTGYAVDGITGTLTATNFDSVGSFSGTITGTYGPNFSVDDLVYPSAPNGFVVDDFGLGITLYLNPTTTYQLAIGAANGNPGYYNVACCGGGEPIYDYQLVTLGAPVAATPLPAAFPLLAGGLGAMGLLGWRKKRKTLAA
jgi:hypothetical protein